MNTVDPNEIYMLYYVQYFLNSGPYVPK